MNRAVAILGLGVVAFAVTLAIYIGSHLSNDAMSVLTGAACGLGAMLPVALIVGLALLRRREREESGTAYMSPHQPIYPPVIVVAPPATNAAQLPGSPYTSAPPVAFPRQFTVIGDDPLDSQTD